MRNDHATPADLAGKAVALARTAGATYQLATALLADGSWRPRLARASSTDVFAPLAESLEVWDRLRVPWGRVAVIEETARALAIRDQHEAAFVLWGAADASGIQAPSKAIPPPGPPLRREHRNGTVQRLAKPRRSDDTRPANAYARETLTAVLSSAPPSPTVRADHNILPAT
jgi:hypothetical protein